MSFPNSCFIEFPSDFNVENVRKTMVANDKLIQARIMIINSIKKEFMSSQNNFMRNPGKMIPLAVCRICLNYNDLSVIHSELVERGFLVEYDIIIENVGHGMQKTISYEDIDIGGNIPTTIRINLPPTEESMNTTFKN